MSARTNISWDEYFMSLCYLVAMRSKDQNTNVGAVIVGPDNEIRSTGYNSFPRNCDDNIAERQERPEKYFWFEHGERNAIFNAARIGVSLNGCRIYVPGIPCMDCARAIVQSGIREVITHDAWKTGDTNRKTWDEHHKRTIELFAECNIHLRTYYGPVVVEIKGWLNKEELELNKTYTDEELKNAKILTFLNEQKISLSFPVEQYSCADCQCMETCEFSFDDYNTNNDCLAEK